MIAWAALDAALEEIPCAAYVLDRHAELLAANRYGQAQTEGAPESLALAQACVKGVADDRRFRVVTLGKKSRVQGFLVLDCPPFPPAVALDYGNSIGLTPGQNRVLELLSRGFSNRTIAAELDLAERTIEAHVTAILVKAQCTSRSALIVELLGAPRRRAPNEEAPPTPPEKKKPGKQRRRR